MNLKSGRIEQFEQYSQFSSLKEFNHHIEMWLSIHKKEFSKGELVGLKRLVRFAAKIPGVCNAKIGTMLKAIHEEFEGNGISRSTFKRMIQKAISIGILKVHETERKNGSQSSNLYVFQPFPKSEPPKQEKLNHHKETIIPFETTIKNNTKRKEIDSQKQSTTNFEKETLDDTYTNDRVPYAFSQVARCFFPHAKSIEEYWKMAKIAAYRNNRETETELVLNTAIHSFKQMINKLKTSTVHNPIAYFYGILNKKFEELYFEELLDMGFCEGKIQDQYNLDYEVPSPLLDHCY